MNCLHYHGGSVAPVLRYLAMARYHSISSDLARLIVVITIIVVIFARCLMNASISVSAFCFAGPNGYG